MTEWTQQELQQAGNEELLKMLHDVERDLASKSERARSLESKALDGKGKPFRSWHAAMSRAYRAFIVRTAILREMQRRMAASADETRPQ
jgi:hypothetical protein